MTFDDIDTPATAEELGGIIEDDTETTDAAPAPVDTDEVAAENVPEVPEVKHETEREQVIPRARFDEVNAKYRANLEEVERLRAELNETKASAAAPATAEAPADDSATLAELATSEYNAILDGDISKAVEIRLQAEAIRDERAKKAAYSMVMSEQEKLSQAAVQRKESEAVADAVERTVVAFPFLDSNSPAANQDAINEVVEWRDFYISKGESPAVAIDRAVNKVTQQFAGNSPASPPEPKADKRKQEAMARNAAESRQQAPAAVAGMGNRTNPPLMKVDTQEQWDKLSKEDRAALLA